MTVAAVTLVLALELGVVGWDASSLCRLLSPRGNDLADLALTAAAFLGLTGFAQIPASHVAAMLSSGPSLLANWPIAATIVGLLSTDFLLYWYHRAFHSRFLWPVHALHHIPGPMSPLTSARHNPLYYAGLPLIAVLPVWLLGIPPWGVALYGLIFPAWGYLAHSALPADFGWLGRWLVSPVAHKVHHSDDPALFDRNFGGLFIIWDRIFGTYLANPYSVAVPDVILPDAAFN